MRGLQRPGARLELLLEAAGLGARVGGLGLQAPRAPLGAVGARLRLRADRLCTPQRLRMRGCRRAHALAQLLRARRL